jgi:hypothetical protein
MYEVEWLDAAVQELASIWLAADSGQRARINHATRVLDKLFDITPIRKASLARQVGASFLRCPSACSSASNDTRRS